MGRRQAARNTITRNGVEATPLTSREAHILRNDFYRIVRDAMPHFRAFVLHTKGEPEWTPTRLKAFALAVSRVLPEMTAKDQERDPSQKRLMDLTVEELQALAATGIRAQSKTLELTAQEPADAPAEAPPVPIPLQDASA